ncbi:MAG TPA: HAD family hydrolase [Verrucomicrobiae bacterium]|nr:HAD family hydrolase [Verrucomicrobiae bacterium]
MKVSAVLFDADGVLTLPEEAFSVVYARSHGLDNEPFEHFFRNEWRDFVTGKRDLKEAITNNPELWQWDGDADSLLDYWFKSEDIRNDALIALIRELDEKGLACYLATEQEKYRAAYMKDVMFKGLFRDQFVTCEIGFKKSETAFYEEIIRRLQAKQPTITPGEIVFFDDSQDKVDTAHSVGINAQLYTGIDHVKEVLSDWAG